MVDFIKVSNVGIDPAQFLKNPLLMFTDRIDRATGELIEGAKSAKYRDMRFFISSKGVTGLAGSLHKYYNEGIHNYNDFTLDNLKLTIEDLQSRFSINPATSTLNNIEFGVNLEVPFNPDDFIDHLVTHNYTQFNIDKDKTMNYAQVSYHQFNIKIYNKGLQFGLGRNILRFEVKIVRMAKLAKYDIRTLQDLLIPEKLQSVLELLLQVFDQITYWDESIELNLLSQQERELLRDGYNPKFWQDHLKKAGSNASKKFRQYQGLIRKYGNPDFYNLGQLISDKWNILLQNTSEPIRDITGYQSLSDCEPIRDFTAYSNVSDSKSIYQVSEEKPYRDTSSYNLSIGKDLVQSSPGYKRVCQVTGLDISMQKGTSRFLSITGIRYYRDYQPDVFKELQNRLSGNWTNESPEKRIKEIAHSIRNSLHSKRIHTQKAIRRLCNSPSLFDNNELISQEKKNIANQ
jgi:hypothetical protein